MDIVAHCSRRILDFGRQWIFLIFFFLCCLSRHLRVYISDWSLSFSLGSVFLFATGFFCGPWFGSLSGAAIDIIFFPWESEQYSFMFLFQTMAIGFAGGIRWIIENFNNEQKEMIFFLIVAGFSSLYLLLFPELKEVICLYGFLFLLLWWFGDEIKLNSEILISLAFLIYFVSCGIGVAGSCFTKGFHGLYFYFKSRLVKNFIYLIVLLGFRHLFLGSRLCLH